MNPFKNSRPGLGIDCDGIRIGRKARGGLAAAPLHGPCAALAIVHEVTAGMGILQCGILDATIYFDFLDLGFGFAAGAGSDIP